MRICRTFSINNSSWVSKFSKGAAILYVYTLVGEDVIEATPPPHPPEAAFVQRCTFSPSVKQCNCALNSCISNGCIIGNDTVLYNNNNNTHVVLFEWKSIFEKCIKMALKHVVIGGGTGYIGRCLELALKNEGAKVTIVSRMPGVSRLSWTDLARYGLPSDTTAVINVAGQNILDPTRRWTTGFKQNVWNSRVETTKALAKAVTQCDVKVFATISGVAYYKTDGQEYTEDDKCETYDYLSELCHAWEDAAKLPSNCSTKQVTIRSGVVLGRTGGMIAQTFWPFYLGLGGPIGSGDQYMPWIHIEDLVYLFLYSLENAVHPILNGVAPQLVTNKEFTKAFASALWRPAIIPLPTFFLNILFNEERAKIMTEGQKVIPKRVLESGFEYEYPDIKKACSQFGKLIYINQPF